MPPSLGERVDLAGRIEWTASGRERWLAAATIATLGLLSLSLHVVYTLRTDPSASAFVLGPGIPLALSAVIVGLSGWLLRSSYRTLLARIALWCVGGALVLVAIGQLLVLHLRTVGADPGSQLFVLAYMETNGTIIGLIVGVYDAGLQLTKQDLDEQRERAERLSERLSVLNRVLRHDLRTGVEVIRSYAGVLPNPPDVPPEVPVRRIQESATEMFETAESAREAQQVLERDEPRFERVDVATTLADIAASVREDYPDAEVNTEIEEGASVETSPLVDLALEELVENAAEHAGDAPEIEVHCADRGNAVVARVVDDGPGIPDAELEPIRRGEETDLQHMSGLGLWLANWIVESTDGTISFDDGEDGGAAVTVRLPRGSPDPRNPAGTPA